MQLQLVLLSEMSLDVPVITLLTTRKMTVAVGSNVTISATVSGNNVRWLAMWEFGVNPLWESAEQLDFTQKRQWTVKLSINSLSYTDQGTYRLAVSNKYATRKMSPQVELTIQGKTVFIPLGRLL